MTKNETLAQFETGKGVQAIAGQLTGGAGHEPEMDRNSVFGSLVTGNEDIVGLVAYSIYKQNKHDWLVAFNKGRGREPNDDELASYIIGESTPRRLATYRHLAQATLEGRGPTPDSAGSESFKQRNYAIAARAAQPQTGTAHSAASVIIGALGLAIVAALGVYLAIRYNLIALPKP